MSELDGNAAMKELKENGCLKLDSKFRGCIIGGGSDYYDTGRRFVTEGDNNVTVVMYTRLTLN